MAVEEGERENGRHDFQARHRKLYRVAVEPVVLVEHPLSSSVSQSHTHLIDRHLDAAHAPHRSFASHPSLGTQQNPTTTTTAARPQDYNTRPRSSRSTDTDGTLHDVGPSPCPCRSRHGITARITTVLPRGKQQACRMIERRSTPSAENAGHLFGQRTLPERERARERERRARGCLPIAVMCPRAYVAADVDPNWAGGAPCPPPLPCRTRAVCVRSEIECFFASCP